MRVKIVVTVPPENANNLRAAIGGVGAGKVGEYTYCSFSVKGRGRFVPSSEAEPHIGTAGELENVEEERIEVTCDKTMAKAVIGKIREAHPYEEPSIDVYELLSEENL